jgi:hypothetical protein
MLLAADTATWLAAKLSLYWKRQHRYRGQHVLLATMACPPSDCLLENLSWTACARGWRKVRQLAGRREALLQHSWRVGLCAGVSLAS